MKKLTKRTAKKEPLWTRDFVLITVCNLLIFLAFIGIPTSLPIYLKSPSIDAPDSLIGLAVGITTVASLLFRPVAGLGIDRSNGRRILFVVGAIVMILTVGVLGLIPSVLFVLVIRFLMGAGFAAANTAGPTIATDVVPRSRFGEGIGYFSLSSSVALAVAPAATLFILTDLKLPFEIITFSAAVLVLLALVLSFFLRIKKSDQSSSQSQIANNSGFSFRNLFEKSALLPSAVVFANCLILGSVNSFIALHTVSRGIENISLYFMVYAVVLLISRPFFGKLVDKRGYRMPVVCGLTCSAVALFLIAMADSIVWLIAAGIIFGIGQGLAVSALQTMAIADAPFERRGTANSTFFLGHDAGIGIGAFCSGLIASVLGYGNLYLVMIAAPVFACIIYLIFGRNRTNPTAHQDTAVNDQPNNR